MAAVQDLWYYSSSDQAQGPFPLRDLEVILSNKANSENVLVWRQGMSTWQRAGEIGELKSIFSPKPPPIPITESQIVGTQIIAENRRLHPWRRFFARTMDVYIFTIPFFVVLGLTFPLLFADSTSSSSTQVTDLLYSMGVLAAYAIFESFCLWAFGQTLGKLVYGIKVEPETGGQFTLKVAFKRSLAVWARGMGLGIPIVALFTLITGYRTLKNEGRSSWDRDFNTIVRHRDFTWARGFLIGIVWLALVAVYFGLIALGTR